jgi:hypothetical protein
VVLEAEGGGEFLSQEQVEWLAGQQVVVEVLK